ncbi:MAG: ABC transporter permease [Chloroflexi bacterium]|nr:ABC transporter permease [Chloroflexota bacterium]
MGTFLARRLIFSAFVLLGVSVIVFGLLRLSGDPTALMLPIDATEEDEIVLRRALGLDEPLPVQYLTFLSRAVVGDFGTSIRHRQPALQMVAERIPATLELAALSFVVALLIALPLGIFSALYPNSFIDRLSVLMALVGQAVPTFLLGIILILVVSVQLQLLPAFGRGGIENLILPALTLGTYSAAFINRLLRSSILEVLDTDFIRTARAKGFANRYIVIRHALKNAAIPVITVMGLQVSALLSGSVVTETVFAYPGAGLLLVQALGNRDFPVVQAFVMVIAVLVIIINLVVDVIYGLVDPRVQITG